MHYLQHNLRGERQHQRKPRKRQRCGRNCKRLQRTSSQVLAMIRMTVGAHTWHRRALTPLSASYGSLGLQLFLPTVHTNKEQARAFHVMYMKLSA